MSQDKPHVVLVGRRNGARRAARNLGLRATVVDPDASVEDFRPAHRVDAVAAVTEGSVLPAARLRERLQLPGLSLAAAERCTDKLAMKRAVQAAGIRCTDFAPLKPGPFDARPIIERLGLPLVIKHRRGAGGRGAIVARTREAIPVEIAVPSLAEAFVHGTEMSIESFVIGGRPVFVNFTEYVEPAWASLLPAEIPPEQAAALLEINAQAISALGIERGMTHFEVFLTDRGCVFGELAARPPGGKLMSLISLAWDFDPWVALLQIELGQTDSLRFPDLPRQSAAMRFIHPGAGRVRAVRGLTETRGLETLVELTCRLEPGDHVESRDGTGQHRGYALFAGPPKQVRSDLEAFRQTLVVDMAPGDAP